MGSLVVTVVRYRMTEMIPITVFNSIPLVHEYSLLIEDEYSLCFNRQMNNLGTKKSRIEPAEL
jgi:hypothetical protein